MSAPARARRIGVVPRHQLTSAELDAASAIGGSFTGNTLIETVAASEAEPASSARKRNPSEPKKSTDGV